MQSPLRHKWRSVVSLNLPSSPCSVPTIPSSSSLSSSFPFCHALSFSTSTLRHERSSLRHQSTRLPFFFLSDDLLSHRRQQKLLLFSTSSQPQRTTKLYDDQQNSVTQQQPQEQVQSSSGFQNIDNIVSGSVAVRSQRPKEYEPLSSPMDDSAAKSPSASGQQQQQPQELQMLSFYRFVPIVPTASGTGGYGDDNGTTSDDDNTDVVPYLTKIRDEVFDAIKEIPGLRGTIYLATEGINGQLACPPQHVNEFVSSLQQSLPFNPFHNTVPMNHDNDNYNDNHCNGLNLGDIVSIDTPTFERLIVRTRDYILRDGIHNNTTTTTTTTTTENSHEATTTLDWTDPGLELSPEQWHHELTEATAATEATSTPTGIASRGDDHNKDVMVIDCRNTYESDEGMFRGAIPLATNTFQESWTKLTNVTKDTPKDTPVYIYCTGGIRCVKTGAYLKQQLGFTNVRRLQNGIIGYERWINDNQEQQPTQQQQVQRKSENGIVGEDNEVKEGDNVRSSTGSLSPTPLTSVWEGKNFLFDKRREVKKESE